ncbi:hypothetical protein ABZ897_17415 [Nonomuraea sp. NPDC046802]|uniref:hypothetical protein n=1 Tax=Nonomuraea sp. NPDC046802 TaxID=3154919 RepID=UPI0033E363DC
MAQSDINPLPARPGLALAVRRPGTGPLTVRPGVTLATPQAVTPLAAQLSINPAIQPTIIPDTPHFGTGPLKPHAPGMPRIKIRRPKPRTDVIWTISDSDVTDTPRAGVTPDTPGIRPIRARTDFSPITPGGTHPLCRARGADARSSR